MRFACGQKWLLGIAPGRKKSMNLAFYNLPHPSSNHHQEQSTGQLYKLLGLNKSFGAWKLGNSRWGTKSIFPRRFGRLGGSNALQGRY
jgi:hypothetical protein